MTIIPQVEPSFDSGTAANRAAYTAGLRALADILDAHPELPLPWQGGQYSPMTFHFLSVGNPRAAMAAARRALGVPMDKQPRDDGYFDMEGTIHGLHVRLNAYRKDVCERVVLATRSVVVEEPDPAALAAVPKVKRTVVVEDVEWQCHPVLAAEQAEAVTV